MIIIFQRNICASVYYLISLLNQARAWFLNITSVRMCVCVCMCVSVCVCVCVSAPEAMNN